MEVQKSVKFRAKIFSILIPSFFLVWMIVISSVSSVPISTGLGGISPAAMVTVTLCIALCFLWFAISPADEKFHEAQLQLHNQITSYSRKKETAEKDIRFAKTSIDVANEARHEFLSTMSRELRVPLNTIIGYSTLLYENRQGPDGLKKARRFAFDINKAAMHLLMIVNDILDISKLGTGTTDLRIEKVSVHQLIEECHTLTEIRGTKEGLAIVYDLPTHDVSFACDISRMKQILLNILSNAVTFTDPPNIITVSVKETDDDYIEFRVTDEGIGVPVDDLEIVLQRFGRVDSQTYTQRHQESTGLGLTLVQELTKMHDGYFKFESVEGVGTTVTIKIPTDLMVNTNQSAV